MTCFITFFFQRSRQGSDAAIILLEETAHKNPISLCDPSSGTAERLSAFMDYFLQPLMKQIKSCIQDSTDLIRRPSRPHPLASRLHFGHHRCVCIVPQHTYRRMKVLMYDDNHPQEDDIPFPRELARMFLHTVLCHNCFEFDWEMFEQVKWA